MSWNCCLVEYFIPLYDTHTTTRLLFVHLFHYSNYNDTQYGVLGHGTDHEHNTSATSVKIAYESQPVPRVIRAFGETKIVRIACGSQHTIAVDENGGVWTWGNGDYGRLGHNVQKCDICYYNIRYTFDANIEHYISCSLSLSIYIYIYINYNKRGLKKNKS